MCINDLFNKLETETELSGEDAENIYNFLRNNFYDIATDIEYKKNEFKKKKIRHFHNNPSRYTREKQTRYRLITRVGDREIHIPIKSCFIDNTLEQVSDSIADFLVFVLSKDSKIAVFSIIRIGMNIMVKSLIDIYKSIYWFGENDYCIAKKVAECGFKKSGFKKDELYKSIKHSLQAFDNKCNNHHAIPCHHRNPNDDSCDLNFETYGEIITSLLSNNVLYSDGNGVYWIKE